MTSTKQRPTVGDIRYQVEWCSKLAFYESGDVDHDRCEMTIRVFATRAKARAFAEKIYPETTDKWGIVEVDQIEFVPYDEDDVASMPHVGYWQHIGETEIFSGEWET